MRSRRRPRTRTMAVPVTTYTRRNFALISGSLLIATAVALMSACGVQAQDTTQNSPTRIAEGTSDGGKRVYTKPSDSELREKLTSLQYKVTQKDGTERAFDNEYWDNKEPGIYVDIVSGEPLFASIHKYKSGTGWPSFWQPLVADNIVEREDRKLFMKRVEVRSKHGDSHLGHVFNDGPRPTGMRYCMNSAAMRFIAVADLEREGYGEFLSLFSEQIDAKDASQGG